LNEPGACVPPVAENLSFAAAGIFVFLQENLSRHFGMGRNRIIQRETSGRCQNSENKEWREDTDETGAGGQHGDDLIGARHPTKNEKESEKERDWQQDDQNLWDLGSVKFQNAPESEMEIKEGRNAVADIEDQPDRNEPDDAVKVGLQEVPGDISIK
jgi:hypothetical protein